MRQLSFTLVTLFSVAVIAGCGARARAQAPTNAVNLVSQADAATTASVRSGTALLQNVGGLPRWIEGQGEELSFVLVDPEEGFVFPALRVDPGTLTVTDLDPGGITYLVAGAHFSDGASASASFPIASSQFAPIVIGTGGGTRIWAQTLGDEGLLSVRAAQINVVNSLSENFQLNLVPGQTWDVVPDLPLRVEEEVQVVGRLRAFDGATVSGDSLSVSNQPSRISRTSDTASNVATHDFRRQRVGPANVQENDFIGEILFSPRVDGDFSPRAAIRSTVDGSVAGDSAPSNIEFYAGSTGLEKRMTINSDGVEVEDDLAVSGDLVVDGEARYKRPLIELGLSSIVTPSMSNSVVVGDGAGVEIAFEDVAFPDGFSVTFIRQNDTSFFGIYSSEDFFGPFAFRRFQDSSARDLALTINEGGSATVVHYDGTFYVTAGNGYSVTEF